RLAADLEASGLRLVHVEDILGRTSLAARLAARLFWRFALTRRAPDEPALVIAGRMEEGRSEALVFSQRNVLTNVLQLLTRIDLSATDRIVNFLPSHHC